MTCSIAPCRLYENPCPPQRVVLDAVSTMKLNVRSSLAAGILQKCSVTFEFPHYVFNYLFNAKGDRMRNRPGKLYEKKDFNTYFPDDSFVCYNHQHKACAVAFQFTFIAMLDLRNNSSIKKVRQFPILSLNKLL